MMPIINLIRNEYDELRRDEDNVIVYEDGKLGQIADNLLKHEVLDSKSFNTYDEFINSVSNKFTGGNLKIHPLDKGGKTDHKYVNDTLTRQVWQNWKPGNQIFISAGTGRGKNTFIKNELLSSVGSQKVVIFENRRSLMQQQIKDLIEKIDPDFLKYNDVSEESMVIFGKNRNIMLISYQAASLKCLLNNSNFINFCREASYLVFDEAHFILDDSMFNKGINFFVNCFLPKNSFPNATKIFLSGTMEEFYEYLQRVQNGITEPYSITKLSSDLQTSHISSWLYGMNGEQYHNLVLSLPTDYSYINPYKYRSIDDICKQIEESPENEKWMVFVNSLEEGEEYKAKLEIQLKENVCFLSSPNKSNNKRLYDKLINECKFDCRVLIATTVIYNGINVKDKDVKHIVVPFQTVSIVKQIIGRKRIENDNQLNVYFPDVEYKTVRKMFTNCLKDCFEILNLERNIEVTAILEANGVSTKKASKYYFINPYPLQDENRVQRTTLYPILSIPAIYKLYYDMCFYIFIMQRMDPEFGIESDFVNVMLTHLDIEEKREEIVDVTIKTNEDFKNEFIEYLDSIVGKEITSEDEFYLLKKQINELFKHYNNGNKIDPQWTTTNRPISSKKIKPFFDELNIPYSIESKKRNGLRKTIVMKK